MIKIAYSRQLLTAISASTLINATVLVDDDDELNYLLINFNVVVYICITISCIELIVS